MKKTILIGLLASSSLFAASVEKTLSTQASADHAARHAQGQINTLADQEEKMAQEYAQVMAQFESLDAYNRQLTKLLASQATEQADLHRQISDIEHTQQNLLPLMLDMQAALKQFVALDAPFLPEERKQRISTISEMMDRADVSSSEKYRRLLEAFQIEIEYGRSIEAYSGLLDDGSNRHVDFLRIGRIALLYLSLDGEQSGYWDANKKAWIADKHYLQAIRDGLRMARKQAAPKLLVLPVKTAAL